MTSKTGKCTRGKLIVFEGPDGSGKRTQARLLVGYLTGQGLAAEYIEFPQYDSTFGKLVAKYLRGEFGALNTIPAEIPAMLFALDRYQERSELESKLAKGHYVIANRYSESNLGYQAARFSGRARTDFIKWLDELESRLPRSDLVIYLHLPIEDAQERIRNRRGKKYLRGRGTDIHEQDAAYQKRVAETYMKVANRHRNKWMIIHCKDENGIKSRERVHIEITRALRKKFKRV